jgi:hemerythrin-like domain-containing protein
MKLFTDLLGLHEELADMFLAQQYALLRFDFSGALSVLKAYETALLKHMADEESLLMPIYEQRAVSETGGSSQLFLKEHVKMRGWVTFFREQIGRLAEDPKPEADLILLLDRESFYKRLCSHHDRREALHLYPEMDRITTETEKVWLLERVTCTFSSPQAT